MEYSYHDWALSQFALGLGRKKEAAFLIKQSQRWRTLFDPLSKVVRPKKKNGNWVSSFDPEAMDDSWWLSLIVRNHGGPGFVEGNAFQYTYMIPHDISGLIDLFGSKKQFSTNLKSVFENNQFSLWNEPDMIYPYLLSIDTSELAKMQKIIQNQRTTHFTTLPNGIPGNDDAGALSGWNVFSALGFYPVNPASGEYVLGVPWFNDIQISIPNSDTLFKICSNFNTHNEQWERVNLNNKGVKKTNIKHEDILKGGELQFIRKTR